VEYKARGALPPSKWKATLPTWAQARGRPAVSVATTFRRKIGPAALRLRSGQAPRFSLTGTGRGGESGAAGGVCLCEECRWDIIRVGHPFTAAVVHEPHQHRSRLKKQGGRCSLFAQVPRLENFIIPGGEPWIYRLFLLSWVEL